MKKTLLLISSLTFLLSFSVFAQLDEVLTCKHKCLFAKRLIKTRLAKDKRIGLADGSLMKFGNLFVQKVKGGFYKVSDLNYAWLVVNFNHRRAYLIRNGFLRLYSGIHQLPQGLELGVPLADESSDGYNNSHQPFQHGYTVWRYGSIVEPVFY